MSDLAAVANLVGAAFFVRVFGAALLYRTDWQPPAGSEWKPYFYATDQWVHPQYRAYVVCCPRPSEIVVTTDCTYGVPDLRLAREFGEFVFGRPVQPSRVALAPLSIRLPMVEQGVLKLPVPAKPTRAVAVWPIQGQPANVVSVAGREAEIRVSLTQQHGRRDFSAEAFPCHVHETSDDTRTRRQSVFSGDARRALFRPVDRSLVRRLLRAQLAFARSMAPLGLVVDPAARRPGIRMAEIARLPGGGLGINVWLPAVHGMDEFTVEVDAHEELVEMQPGTL